MSFIRTACGRGSLLIGLTLLAVCPLPTRGRQRPGAIVEEVIDSRALAGNLLGDSPRRPVQVYLPPSYPKSPSRRYPVVFLLHGYKGTYKQWMAGGAEWNIRDVLDGLIAAGKVGEMIVVMPDVKNRLGGSFYTDSVVTGNWDEFLTRELVGHIDKNYRTLARAESRGIAGHSMGGYGALLLAMKHPDTFGAVYSLSAAVLGWGGDLSTESPIWDTTLSYRTLADWDRAPDSQYIAQAFVAMAAAWSPNPDRPPFYGDYPVTGSGRARKRQEDACARWSANMPVNMVDQYRANLARLRGIAFDVGKQDQFPHIPLTNRALAAALQRNGISHTFEEYDGDHNNRVPGRFETKMLPFFSRVLAPGGPPAPRN
jgi:S-formylglutathione hydrolase FrmB